jgi:hypothetical protein
MTRDVYTNGGMDIHKQSSNKPVKEHTELVDLDLVIVALSSPFKDPIQVLSEATLEEAVEETPLLTISRQPPQVLRGERVTHLGFPFDIEAFQIKVSAILYPETMV